MPTSNDQSLFQPRFLLLAGMVLAAASMRLVPHDALANFAPIGAVALFGGAHFTRKRWAFLVPLAALLISDLLLYSIKYPQFWNSMLTTKLTVYASFVLIVCLGLWLRSRRKVHTIAAATLAGSLLFFVITNFGAWAFFEMYPKTPAGLIECYVAGIPFFRNTLLSDALFVTVLFGAFALAEARVPALRERRAVLDAS